MKNYEIKNLLGKGNNSSVYLVENLSTRIQYAMKKIPMSVEEFKEKHEKFVLKKTQS